MAEHDPRFPPGFFDRADPTPDPVFYEPVRPGDRLVTSQILRSVSGEKTTKLGTGRFWVIDVEYRNQRGDRVAVESYTGFGYRRADRTEEGS